MNDLFRLLLTSILALANTLVAGQDLDIQISVAKDRQCLEEPILLVVHVTNRTDSIISIQSRFADKWSVEVLNNVEHKYLDRSNGVVIRSGRVGPRPLKVDSSTTYFKWLHDLVEFTESGRAKILVDFELWYKLKGEEKSISRTEVQSLKLHNCSKKKLKDLVDNSIARIQKLDQGEHLTISPNQGEILLELEKIHRIPMEGKEEIYYRLIELSEFSLIQRCIYALIGMKTESAKAKLEQIKEDYSGCQLDEWNFNIQGNLPLNTSEARRRTICEWLE